ncbi:MAG: hypothetical protein ABIK98_15985 [Pseudomonadota bacterium]|uniref:Uncharacterized protein n=1 Tax=Candidatus Desulfatibia profunda TaxID=2841695 RepID=A0A8J6NXL4_9BACT|nr:hypothetical protein [Candidatus Desulfatibia profunda]MBL7179697.1 hypothetical protein [Desulfobacterales bacterium]
MTEYYHTFHIPVMGTGFSVDTPIRVAPLGITSVISLVDDLLLDKVGTYYAEKYGLPYTRIPPADEDGRAKRITVYLDTVLKIVQKKTNDIRRQSFFENNTKRKYFELLPEESPLKKTYHRLLNMKSGAERNALAKDLTGRMQPGSIDVNIMVKIDRINYDKSGNILGDEYSDAKAALRGYANSSLRSCIVFSAGVNQRLFNYMPRFRDFYRDKLGQIKKRIILKVSDFRSALIQGKFLAKRGLEVYEFRIESGLNCGGHAFASNGILLPSLLKEFKEKRNELAADFLPLIRQYYQKMGWKYPDAPTPGHPLITVQGGIGTHGEVCRLREDFDMDRTGWASPFLLVPEATCVDDATRELLRQAGQEELYLSDVSPLGIPFNNLRQTGSELWTSKRVAQGKPGSPCPNSYLKSNTEFTEIPICLASRQYQKTKLEAVDRMQASADEKTELRRQVVEKTCICNHLGNGALIALGIAESKNAPQAICPGPNIAWFNKLYTLQEMVDHIYGRGPCLVPDRRPHMFAKEIEMYVDYFGKMVAGCKYTSTEINVIKEFKENLEEGLELCMDIARNEPFPGENLASIPPCVARQKERLRAIWARFEQILDVKHHNQVYVFLNTITCNT